MVKLLIPSPASRETLRTLTGGAFLADTYPRTWLITLRGDVQSGRTQDNRAVPKSFRVRSLVSRVSERLRGAQHAACWRSSLTKAPTASPPSGTMAMRPGKSTCVAMRSPGTADSPRGSLPVHSQSLTQGTLE